MITHDEDRMLKEIRQALDRSVSAIDSDIQYRLDDIRRQAMQLESGSHPVNDSEDGLIMAVKVGLDDSVMDLEQGIVASLERTRKSALNRINNLSSPAGIWQPMTARLKLPRIAIPTGAFAAACVLMTMAVVFYQIPPQTDNDLAEAEVLLFASGDEIELYGDLEFYLWLADSGLPN